MAFQARTPDPEVQQALETYGHKLNKKKDEIKRELRALVAQNSRPAPAFEVDSYTSAGKVKLSDLKGKVVLLSFWYPGCGPCRGEMPHIEAALKGIDRNKLVYLGVNGLRDQDGFVLPFMKGTGYSFTPLGASGGITEAYGVRAYPTNLLIDQDGNIAYSRFMVNAANEKMLELMIRSLTDAS
jgi:thiol-disulfide isomerase/thioredoxin